MTWRRRYSAHGYRRIAVALARLVEMEGEKVEDRSPETEHIVLYARWAPEIWMEVITAASECDGSSLNGSQVYPEV